MKQTELKGDPTTIYPPGPEWHRPPEPIEELLLGFQANRIADLTQQLKSTPRVTGGMGGCIIDLQRDTPAYRTMVLANLFNHMVDEKMPGYVGRDKLEAPSDSELDDLGALMQHREVDCVATLPPCHPDFDPTYNERDENAKLALGQGFRALQQMGYAMSDYFYASKPDETHDGKPSKTFCRAAYRALNVWQLAYSKMEEGVDRDNYDIYHEKFSSSYYKICAIPEGR